MSETELKNVPVSIQLNEENRCIAMDCVFLDSDTVIEKTHEELPLPYAEFARKLDEYVYRNDTFVHEPRKQAEDPIQLLIHEQERQGKALEEVISMLLGGE